MINCISKCDSFCAYGGGFFLNYRVHKDVGTALKFLLKQNLNYVCLYFYMWIPLCIWGGKVWIYVFSIFSVG